MTDTCISGWYESCSGAVMFDYENVEDFEELAQLLYLNFGDDCSGVCLEVEGQYCDGTEVNTQLEALLDDLDFLCN